MLRTTLPAALVALSLAACTSAVRPPSAPAPATPPPSPPARIYSRAEITPLLDSLVGQQQFRTANWGILVFDPASGDTIYAHSAAKLFVPASNTKIATGSVALTTLGPDYTWKTNFAARGEVRNGVLQGDLVVFGRGDPTVSSRVRGDAMTPLREIADSLVARGIRRVAGRIVQGGDAFPGSHWGAGWQLDYLDADYGAGVDELFFNEGTVRIVVRGGAVPGQPALITTSPSRTYPVVRSQVVTEWAADSSRTRIRLDVDSLTGDVAIAGYILPGDSSVQTLVLRDPATAYLFALREALAERGILVDSLVTPGATVAESEATQPLFTYHSAPLREVLAQMMKPSQNQMAEIFLRTIGLEVTGVGTAANGLRTVRDSLLKWGVASDGFAFVDGSGLTRNNYISPESVTRILNAMRQNELYPDFYNALSIAGVDGTLGSRMRGTPAANNVRGKTGTLSRASALSGYVRTLDGHDLIFSTFCNNFTAPATAVTGMQNTIATMLASLQWKQ